MHEVNTVGGRVREVRKRRGLSQRKLATQSGVSLSLISKLEQGEREDTRLETLHKLAIALRVPTTALATGPDAPIASPQSAQRWEPVRRAIDGAHEGRPDDEPTLQGLTAVFEDALPLLLRGRFTQIGAALPALLRDADALVGASVDGAATQPRTLRALIRQAAGSLMLHTWQFGTAERAFALALEDASDPLTAMSVADERCWGLIRQGKLAETMELAFRWADENEPRMSTATRDELAAWGRLLIRASTAAVRDNRPGEAATALRLARMAATGTHGDFVLSYSPWHVFGPTAVSVIAAENAMIQDRPGEVVAIARQLERTGKPVTRYAPSHHLDVAQAHAALRRYDEAIGVLRSLRRVRPQWLAQQRHAADIVQKIIQRRRTLTPEMRELADFVQLPL